MHIGYPWVSTLNCTTLCTYYNIKAVKLGPISGGQWFIGNKLLGLDTHHFPFWLIISPWVFSIKNAPRIFDVPSSWSQQHLVQPFVSCLWSRQSPQLRWLWVPWIEFQKGPNLRNKNYSNSSFNGFSYLYVDGFSLCFFLWNCQPINPSILVSKHPMVLPQDIN